jgi:hypothetical protein
MPSGDIIIAAIVAPLLILTFLRINGVMVFLGLCLGAVMLKYVGSDANSVLKFALPHASGTVSKSTVDLVLLLGPAVATAVFMVFSVRGKFRMLVNILPSAGAACLGTLLAVPVLSPGLQGSLESQSLWSQLTRAQDLVVGVSALMSLLYLWTQRPHHHKKEEGGKHKH